MFRVAAAAWIPAIAITLGFAPAASAATLPSSALADSAWVHQDWAGAVRGYATFVKLSPAAPRAWYRLGYAQQALEHWPEAIEAYRHADALGVPAAIVRYNIACAFARAAMPDSALATLHRLLDTGWGGTEQLGSDTDFASLRTDPRFAAVVDRSRHNEQPCTFRIESRQFDFWIGDWNVTVNASGGGPAGESHVELILNQCVIFENWKGRAGGSGKSFNAWNADLACWQQNWMDDRGDVTNYSDGHFADGRLLFSSAEKKDAAGKWQRHRLAFYPLDADHVRQLGEHSTDGGATWTADYDLLYTRRK